MAGAATVTVVTEARVARLARTIAASMATHVVRKHHQPRTTTSVPTTRMTRIGMDMAASMDMATTTRDRNTQPLTKGTRLLVTEISLVQVVKANPTIIAGTEKVVASTRARTGVLVTLLPARTRNAHSAVRGSTIKRLPMIPPR